MGAECAILNGGALRNDRVVTGEITKRTVFEVFPFLGTLVSLRLSGADLRSCLENGVSRVPVEDGRFLHVSGIAFAFDTSALIGSRVAAVSVHGADLDSARLYTVATNSYLAAGKEGFKALKAAERVLGDEFGPQVQTAMIDGVKARAKAKQPCGSTLGRITRNGPENGFTPRSRKL